MAACGCDDESGTKNARGGDAGVGDGSATGGDGGSAGSSAAGSGGVAGQAGAGGSAGSAGSGGAAGTAGSAGSAGLGGTAGSAGTGGTGGNPSTLIIDTWGDPLHAPASYIAVLDDAGWTTHSPVALGNTISHQLTGTGDYLALIGCADPDVQERDVIVVAGSFSELPLVRVACARFASPPSVISSGSGTNLTGTFFDVTAGHTTAVGNAANAYTYMLDVPAGTYDLIVAAQGTSGVQKAEIIRQQAVASGDPARAHDFNNVPDVTNHSFDLSGSLGTGLGWVYLWTAGGSVRDTVSTFVFPMDFWEPATLDAGDVMLAMSEEYLTDGRVRTLDVSGGGDVSMTAPVDADMLGASDVVPTGTFAQNTLLSWTQLTDASVYCAHLDGDSVPNGWSFVVTPNRLSSDSFQVPDLTQAPGFSATGLDVQASDLSFSDTCAVQTPLTNGVRGSALSAAQFGANAFFEYYYDAAPPPNHGRYLIHTRYGAGG